MKMQKLVLSFYLFLSIIISATAQISPGTYTITNKNSNLCLAIRGATRSNGEEGTQWTCDGNADKNWKLIDAGGGYFKIQNQNSSLFLAVGGGARDNGGRCIQYLDQGQQDIFWRFINAGAGWYKIQNKNSGLFLAIGAGSRTGGADLIQWADEGQEDLKWKLNAKSVGTTIALSNIDEWLCPKALLRGDREFDGHGPRIKCEVTLSIGDAGRSLYADISLWAQETVHDWSTTEQKWRRKVYDAPYGKTITAINSDKASRTQFISPAGGFQFLVPGNDVAAVVNGFLDGAGGAISNAVLASHGIPSGDFRAVARLITGAVNSGNTVVRVPALEGTLVRFFHIVGDTGGADISDDDNCNDDTRIVKLEFNPVNVTFR